MSSSNIGGEQKTSEDWLWGRELGNRKLLTLSISLCEKLGPFFVKKYDNFFQPPSLDPRAEPYLYRQVEFLYSINLLHRYYTRILHGISGSCRNSMRRDPTNFEHAGWKLCQIIVHNLAILCFVFFVGCDLYCSITVLDNYHNYHYNQCTNHISYMSWGYSLSILNEYVEREQILANNEFSSEILKVWILVSKECNLSIDPESTILSQCETYKHQTLITLLSEQIQEVIGYCITALFTPPKH
ncbi:gnat family acetyltransferase [Gigaspora margarita]|uniref:Gnat family acetyltransferase n=1 Tax=Gigaspora margarita TaxID=4874 RepID=A0A8H4AQE0_GIGMA|nr:gnat family acetyltransferase [Gigaspora margarita]